MHASANKPIEQKWLRNVGSNAAVFWVVGGMNTDHNYIKQLEAEITHVRIESHKDTDISKSIVNRFGRVRKFP